MSIVLFDFDNTLTTIDTTLPFASFLASQKKKQKKYLLLLWIYFLSGFHLISNSGLKRWFAKLFLLNETIEQLRNTAQEFFEHYLALIANSETVDMLQMHAAQGDEVYLVSANFNFFLAPLQNIWPITGIIATRAETSQGLFTGRVKEESCHGIEKISRAIYFLGEGKVKDAIAYGNSSADLHLLAFTRQGFLVQTIGDGSKVSNFLKKYFFLFWVKKYLRTERLFGCKTRITPIETNSNR